MNETQIIDVARDAIFVALTLTVVLPGLGGAVAWLYGLSVPMGAPPPTPR